LAGLFEPGRLRDLNPIESANCDNRARSIL
jgi:hypothetical protein